MSIQGTDRDFYYVEQTDHDPRSERLLVSALAWGSPDTLLLKFTKQFSVDANGYFYLVAPLPGNMKLLKDELGVLSPGQRRSMAYQLVSEVTFLHRHNVVHLNISEANMLVDDRKLILINWRSACDPSKCTPHEIGKGLGMSAEELLAAKPDFLKHMDRQATYVVALILLTGIKPSEFRGAFDGVDFDTWVPGPVAGLTKQTEDALTRQLTILRNLLATSNPQFSLYTPVE